MLLEPQVTEGSSSVSNSWDFTGSIPPELLQRDHVASSDPFRLSDKTVGGSCKGPDEMPLSALLAL